MSLEQKDFEAAKVAVAPRVTLDDIKANIICEVSGRASDLFKDVPTTKGMELLTICVVTTRSGFTVVGTSACASPENFNADLGHKIARDDCIQQLWTLMGYSLREKLAAEAASGA